MPVPDGMIVSKQSQLERLSIRRLGDILAPWVVTPTDARDDYGRDGNVQIVAADGTVSPIAFLFQAKATEKSFGEVDRLSVETRHLRLWSDGVPLWVFFYSSADGSFRARSGRSLAAEADSINPTWREQDTVTVRFPASSEVGQALSLDDIRRFVADEQDRTGGSTSFHGHRRRVVLTDVYKVGQSYNTSHGFIAMGPTGSVEVLEGPAWFQGDLDAADVDINRVLSAALLLYEEVWLAGSFILSAVAALGPELLGQLVEADRISPFAFAQHLAFYAREGERRGTVTELTLQNPLDDVKDMAESLAPLKGDRALAELIVRKRTIFGLDIAKSVTTATEADLRSDEIRLMLGLSQQKSEDGSEPIWDARLATRMLFLNTCLAGAEQIRADVIELEAGLSRIASEKWYSAMRFHRLYETAAAFDSALRAIGVPDLGVVANTIGLPQLVHIANGEAAQAFRDWFWTEVAPGLRTEREDSTLIATRAAKVIGIDPSSLRLATELKLRLVEATGQDYFLGAHGLPRRTGFATRSVRGTDALQRQRRIHATFRAKKIQAIVGGSPDPYGPCPCRLGPKYKFCCGEAVD